MKIRPILPLLLAFTGLAFAEENVPPAGFTALFNGKDLGGWFGWGTRDPRDLLAMSPEQAAEYKKQSVEGGPLVNKTNAKTGATAAEHINAHWKVDGGELVNDGHGLYATTEKDYGDIELLVDYKMLPKGDSGIYLRGVPQVQIWDYTDPAKFALGADKGSGGLWNNEKGSPGKDPLVLADKPFGEWNHFRILMVGSRVTVWLNEKLVVDHAILENYFDKKLAVEKRGPILPKGFIQLQTHGSEIRWKNLFVRAIGSDEACKLLASHGQEGYVSIFNGKDLDGWAGPLDAVKVENGAMVWQEKKGGTPYWNTELSDFQARVEFKLPPGGNNGLAIRYPGTGNTAYEGMCELQVLDDNYEKAKDAERDGRVTAALLKVLDGNYEKVKDAERDGRVAAALLKVLDDNYEKVKNKIDPRQAHGSAYGMVAAARGYQHPIGEWNFEEVTVKGSTLKVELNGSVILDCDLSKVDMETLMAKSKHPGATRTSGFFGFAGHNDPVQFRDVFIKKL